MAVAAVIIVVLLCLLFAYALCRVAARADEHSDRTYAEMKKQQEQKPADPEPARRAGLRIVKG